MYWFLNQAIKRLSIPCIIQGENHILNFNFTVIKLMTRMIRITMAYIKSQGTRPKLKKQRSKTNCPSFVLLTPNSSSILNLKHLRIFFFTLFIMRKYLTLKLFTHHGNQGFTLVTVIFIHYSSSLEFESFIGR